MMNTVYILWQRQLKRFYRNKSRVIGSFAQPLLFLVAFGFGFGPVFEQAGQGSYLQFLVPGIISMSVLFSSIFSGIELIWDKQFGFLKETLVAPVSRLKIMIGKVLGGATIAVMQGIIILLISLLFGFKIFNVWFALLSIISMLITAILFTAIGTAIASKLTDMQGFQLLMNLLVMPLFFLSGALFPLDNLPKAISIITSLNPLTYAVDLIRYFLIGINSFSVVISIIILITLMIFSVVIASKLFSRMEV
ncbi:ABC transporter permease [archaeon]|nr:ABC transporter permease [archaeon]NCP79232.1 ABC transporter permease [archaeon]NCP97821.1 ABC transporter permease [archaeon]NCQ06999.1 ABC transporter permease [archaeon]NCQ50795.1 ABC transporter permease [archaeon]